MPRTDNRDNPLQFRVTPTEETKAFFRKQVSSVRYLSRLMKAIDQRLQLGAAEELPARWDVQLWWRNPETVSGVTKHWRPDDFISAINESRDGFVQIVGEEIGRVLSKEKAKAEIRKHLPRKRLKKVAKKKVAKKKRR